MKGPIDIRAPQKACTCRSRHTLPKWAAQWRPGMGCHVPAGRDACRPPAHTLPWGLNVVPLTNSDALVAVLVRAIAFSRCRYLDMLVIRRAALHRDDGDCGDNAGGEGGRPPNALRALYV